MIIINRKDAKNKKLKRYFNGKPCRHGHICERYVGDGKCCECASIRKSAWYHENKRISAERNKAWYEQNKVRAALWGRAYREGNRGAILSRKKSYREENPLQTFTRNSLQRIENAVGKDRIHRSELELGYTKDDFKSHIESLWLDGMSWENRSEWHIDHIKPLSLFIKDGVADVAVINALSNLQPLWAKDNLSKGDKYSD